MVLVAYNLRNLDWIDLAQLRTEHLKHIKLVQPISEELLVEMHFYHFDKASRNLDFCHTKIASCQSHKFSSDWLPL